MQVYLKIPKAFNKYAKKGHFSLQKLQKSPPKMLLKNESSYYTVIGKPPKIKVFVLGRNPQTKSAR